MDQHHKSKEPLTSSRRRDHAWARLGSQVVLEFNTRDLQHVLALLRATKSAEELSSREDETD